MGEGEDKEQTQDPSKARSWVVRVKAQTQAGQCPEELRGRAWSL